MPLFKRCKKEIKPGNAVELTDGEREMLHVCRGHHQNDEWGLDKDMIHYGASPVAEGLIRRGLLAFVPGKSKFGYWYTKNTQAGIDALNNWKTPQELYVEALERKFKNEIK